MNSSSTKTENTSQSQSQNATSQSAPWWAQQPYIQQGFQTAANALGAAQNAPAPSQFVPQFTPDQLGLYQKMLGYGGDSGLAADTAAKGGALYSTGTGALGAGIGGLTGFAPTSMAGVLSDANLAANDPSVQGRIDAALRDASRYATEVALPQIGRNAAAGGNLNSSRTGIAEGIVGRGLADTAADTSANIRGQVYSQALQSALQRAMSGDTSRLGALTALTGAGGNLASTGLGANAASLAQQGGLFDIANAGVSGQQAGASAPIQEALARYQFATQSPFAGLNDFWNIVGGNQWGGTSNTSGTMTGTGTGTTTSTPSFWQTLGGLMQGAGGLGYGLGFGRR